MAVLNLCFTTDFGIQRHGGLPAKGKEVFFYTSGLEIEWNQIVDSKFLVNPCPLKTGAPLLYFATCFDLSRIVIKHQLNTKIENGKLSKVENVKKVKVKSHWLLISSNPSPLLPPAWPATSSSASHCNPALLLPLLHLEAIGGHHPHNWCLVKFRFAVHNNVGLAWSNPYCLIDLPFKAALKASSHSHWEGLFFTTMD